MKTNSKIWNHMLIILFAGLSACGTPQNHSPQRVSVEKLKEIVFSDTTHYKIVYLYNPLCGSCRSTLSEILDTSKEKQSIQCYALSIDSYRWYLPGIDIFGKGIKPFWISEESSLLYKSDSDYVERILRVFIPDTTVSVFEGTPQTLIFYPNNELLKTHEESFVVPADISFLKDNLNE